MCSTFLVQSFPWLINTIMILSRIWWLFGFGRWVVNHLKFTGINLKTLLIRKREETSAFREINKKLTEAKYLVEKKPTQPRNTKINILTFSWLESYDYLKDLNIMHATVQKYLWRLVLNLGFFGVKKFVHDLDL